MASTTARAFVCSSALLLTACAQAVLPAVDAPLLTGTDLEVMRNAVDAVVLPELRAGLAESSADANADEFADDTLVITPTVRVPIWERPVRTPSMPPPSPLRPNHEVIAEPRPPPPPWLVPSQLTASERAAWETRNRHTREIPELNLTGFSTRRSDGMPCTTERRWNRYVRFSSPAYTTHASAIVYVYFSRGCYGHDWLVRLTRANGRWRVTRQETLGVT